jgi:predicted O-methyltransferase YrrM
MFHDIPEKVLARMQYLERLDAEHRREDVPPLKRLRQIPPATGKFLAVLAAGTPEGTWLEIGTSGGYSALWIALACRAVGRRLITFEVLEDKAVLARETFKAAGVEDVVRLVVGDARTLLSDYSDISFCFLDAEKTHYKSCYDIVVPRLVTGGLLVADNIISHQNTLGPTVRRVMSDTRVDAQIVPIGSGELVCRKI